MLGSTENGELVSNSSNVVTIKEMGDKRPWWQYLDATKWKLFIAALIGVTLDGYDFVLITLACLLYTSDAADDTASV